MSYSQAISYISENDPILGKVIATHPRFDLKPSKEYFKDLISTIISQQLSYKVFRTLEKRLFEKLDNNVNPDSILALPDTEYRNCGLSTSKAKYIKNLAIYNKENPEFFKHISKMTDKEISDGLISIKGIGEWSVQMFLIFNLVRLDVFPVKDLGIRNAIKKLYKLNEVPTEKQMLKIAKKWGNYKTIATWYLWRYHEN